MKKAKDRRPSRRQKKPATPPDTHVGKGVYVEVPLRTRARNAVRFIAADLGLTLTKQQERRAIERKMRLWESQGEAKVAAPKDPPPPPPEPTLIERAEQLALAIRRVAGQLEPRF